MSDSMSKVEADRQLLADANQRGGISKVGAYVRLSGPGWLQSALTLGGGSLASSLYLGVIAGVTMLWLQPLAMIMGIIMLSAIAYVALSTGERPFRAINQHINPVLGWSWLIASMLANMVWALPQYSLFYGVFEQNLLPDVFGPGGQLAGETGKWALSAVVLVISTGIVWSYGSGHWGVKLYEWMLKIIVALIVACFMGVVIRMSMSPEGIDWAAIGAGFIPNINQLFEPAVGFQPLLDKIADPAARDYWQAVIVQQQREVMISAAATAVGINMTFLLPYSMLSKGWTREFRGLATFDLSTGMFIPFVLATSCVIIASANQFHAKLPSGFEVVDGRVVAPEKLQADFDKSLAGRGEQVDGELDLAEQEIAAAMFKRDAGALANSLETLFDSKRTAHFIFGLGVAAMALSTISLLMLVSGFVVCEVLNVPATGWPHRLGCMAAATGILWPILWKGKAAFWLAVVTSNFGMILLPIAYITFLLMLNSKSLLGNDRPEGGKRVLMNAAMFTATGLALFASGWVVWNKTQWYGVGFAGLLLAAVLVTHVTRKPVSDTSS